MEINSELFLIPDPPGYLVFAPLRRMVFRADAATVNMLAALQRGDEGAVDPENLAIQTLKACGVIDGPPEQKPPMPVASRYKPTRVTLFLTSRCNLGCCYCYGNANTEHLELSEEVGRAAIDYIARNCVEEKAKTLSVGFHGGGEPTMAWDRLVTLTAYAREVAERERLELNTGIATNGCFGVDRAKWMAENLSFVSISVDGPPEIQDLQRPFPNGAPSSGIIESVVDVFHEANFPYSVQATFTAETMSKMPEAARYFAKRMKARFLKFEPVSDAGRFADRPEMIPDMKQFGEWYNRAYEVASEEGIYLAFSGIRLWGAAVSYFCGAFIEPFTITPDGYVTACYEACSKTMPFDNVFLIGRHDAEKRDFVIDMDRLNRLRTRNVYNLDPCNRCFCKYSCGGDCATRNFRIHGSEDLTLVGARCEAIREITRFRLRKYVERAAEQGAKQKQMQEVQTP